MARTRPPPMAEPVSATNKYKYVYVLQNTKPTSTKTHTTNSRVGQLRTTKSSHQPPVKKAREGLRTVPWYFPNLYFFSSCTGACCIIPIELTSDPKRRGRSELWCAASNGLADVSLDCGGRSPCDCGYEVISTFST